MKAPMKPGDYHLMVSKGAQSLKVFNCGGQCEWKAEARCWGQHADWTAPNGDTPPGLYRVGVVYDTTGEAPYGRWCVDLEDLEGQETSHGRAGISLHGGGSGLPSPFAPYQGWQNTHGCVRVQNAILERIVALIKRTRSAGHQVYLTVAP